MLQFRYLTNLTTAATPSSGFLLAYDIDGVLKQKDSNGVITLVAGTPSSSGIGTASNGLTVSSGVLKLGAPLSEDTIIDGGSLFTLNTTNLDGTRNNTITAGNVTLKLREGNTELSDYSTYGFINLVTNYGSIYLNGDNNGQSSIDITPTGSLSTVFQIFSGATGNGVSDSSTNNRFILRDIGSKGIIYHGDYSSNFTPNSLVSKKFVTQYVGTSSQMVVPLTYAEAQTHITNSTLVTGTHYKLTDKADLGIVLLAVSTNQFSLEGQGIFLNPDFQAAGTLGADVQGVWYVGGEAGYVNGNIVFWNGNHYEVTDDAAFAGTDPSATPLAYTLLTKSVANGYIEEVDFILYDFTNDTIFKRMDKRKNTINPDYVNSFQWGNDNVTDVEVDLESTIDIQNQRGTIARVKIVGTNAGDLVADETFTGNFINNYIHDSSITLSGSGAFIAGCRFIPQINIAFTGGENYAYKEITYDYSTFDADLDMTNGVNYGLITERITIPPNYNYVGEFRLINNTGQTITQINGLPTTHKCRFYVEDGNTQLFNHISIGVAITNNLVSDGAAINTIVGRTNGSDFIEYERAGNLNRRYNAVILA